MQLRFRRIRLPILLIFSLLLICVSFSIFVITRVLLSRQFENLIQQRQEMVAQSSMESMNTSLKMLLKQKFKETVYRDMIKGTLEKAPVGENGSLILVGSTETVLFTSSNVTNSEDVLAALKGVQSQKGIISVNGDRVVYWKATYEPLKWTLIIMENFAVINTAMSTLLVYIGLATVIALVVSAVLLSYFTGILLTKPLDKTVEVAKAISLGDFSQRLSLDRQDEVGRLYRSLAAMSESLVEKVHIAEVIATGDLSKDVELASDLDMLGKALSIMNEGLNQVIGQINEAVSQVALGSGQVSDSSQSLSQGATEQAASIEEITSSMMELASQTKNNAENASQANQLSIRARESASSGNDQMQEMILAMNEINDSSKEIAKIIKTIDDIAFQTNLLALNAAVEAARAGKHGKGFAVVAQEVRNLAGRSSKAARETAELIDGSVKKVEKGTEIVDRTAQSLKEIMDGTTKVTDLIGEIATASNEQAQGITQVNKSLNHVEQITQQNTANAEETAAAAEELSSQAVQLNHLVSRFKLKAKERNSADEGKVEHPQALIQLPGSP